MRVGKLVEYLQTLEPTVIVVLSSDAEGNSYSPLAGFWEGLYDTDEGSVSDYDGEETGEEPCVVLWPEN